MRGTVRAHRGLMGLRGGNVPMLGKYWYLPYLTPRRVDRPRESSGWHAWTTNSPGPNRPESHVFRIMFYSPRITIRRTAPRFVHRPAERGMARAHAAVGFPRGSG